MRTRLFYLTIALLWASVSFSQSITGELKRWHKITLTFDGPNTSEGATPNPFRDYRLNVTFSNASTGVSYLVPGYYAADGNAAETGATSGNKWRVHFTPDQIGEWSYTASFRTGTDVNMSLDANAGTGTSFNGQTGTFTIAETDKSGVDYRGKGWLQYVNEHYLQFKGDKSWWIKAGNDKPENFLAYVDFDQTTNNHQYDGHIGDWKSGDPIWQGTKGKGIIGIMNYYESVGVNSQYMLMSNIGGDFDDVWPYTAKTEKFRFDCSKLDQWEIVFEYMDWKGVVKHFVLQEQETDQNLDGGALGNERKIYLRELMARFNHHNGVKWNIGEENTNTAQEVKDMFDYMSALDAYSHAIIMHTFPNEYHHNTKYKPQLGEPNFDGISFQGDAKDCNLDTRTWWQQSRDAGHKWVSYHDETSPDQANSILIDGDGTHEDELFYVFYGSIMGGGSGAEWYIRGLAEKDMDDFRKWDELWKITGIGAKFFMENAPFPNLEPCNDLTSTTNDYAICKPNEFYMTYLRNGGTTNINLSEATAQFTVKWFNPLVGGDLQNGSITSVTGGSIVSIGNPPNNATQPWICVLQGSFNALPTANITAPTTGTQYSIGDNVILEASASDSDGSISQVKFYSNNQLTGSDNTAPYSYTFSNIQQGEYSITAVAVDNLGAEGTSASISIFAGNRAPEVSITAPLNGAQYESGQQIVIEASATDTDGSVAKVDFYNGSTLLFTDTEAPYSHTIASAETGIYSIKAIAEDNEGATMESAPIEIFVDLFNYWYEAEDQMVAPWVEKSGTDASNGAYVEYTGAASLNAAPNDGKMTFDFTGKGVYYIWFRVNTPNSNADSYWITAPGETTPVKYNDVGAANGWEWKKLITTTDLASGNHTLTVQYREPGALLDRILITNDVNFIPTGKGDVQESDPPTVSITSPQAGASFDYGQSVTIEIDAQDDVKVLTVEVYIDGANARLAALTGGISYSITLANLSIGSHTITAVATDNLVSVTSVPVTINIVDNTLPTYTLTVINGIGSGDFNEGARITVEANISLAELEFDSWTGDVQYLANPQEANTTLTMPAKDITITAEYKDVVNSTALNKSQAIKVFPNPTNSNLTIQGLNANSHIRIYSITGQLMLHQQTEVPETHVNVDALTQGIYFLEINSDLAEDEVMKIIKE